MVRDLSLSVLAIYRQLTDKFLVAERYGD